MKVTRDELNEIIRTCLVDADLNYLDVSDITDMSYMFYKSRFDGDISKWDVSNVHDMKFMFSNSRFDGSIKDWNLVRCKDDLGLEKYNRDEHLEYLKSNHPEYFFS